jgi:hypothetical protein
MCRRQEARLSLLDAPRYSAHPSSIGKLFYNYSVPLLEKARGLSNYVIFNQILILRSLQINTMLG